MQGQQAAGMLLGLICGMLIVVPIAALLGAVILRAACAIFNNLAGLHNSVPQPGFGKALGICAATMVVNYAVSFLIAAVFGVAAAANGKGPTPIAGLISLPAGFLVMSGMLTAMLPTSFGKSLLLTLIVNIIIVLIGVVFFVVLAAVGIGLMPR